MPPAAWFLLFPFVYVSRFAESQSSQRQTQPNPRASLADTVRRNPEASHWDREE